LVYEIDIGSVCRRGGEEVSFKNQGEKVKRFLTIGRVKHAPCKPRNT